MKVHYDKPGFAPFNMTLCVESEEEARALYAIFNHSDNTRLLPREFADEIRACIGRQYYSVDVIARGISPETFYRRRS